MELEAALRAHAHRVTRPRQAVWDVLVAVGHEHLSAHEIAARVQATHPTINVSSIYRTLALFAELDLVRESRLGDDGASGWERSHGDDVVHLVCTRCGTVQHRSSPAVDDLRRGMGRAFAVEGVDVTVHGRCATCLASGA